MKTQKIVRISMFLIGISMLLCVFWCNSDAGIKGEIEMNSIIIESKVNSETIINFGELANYYAVPPGYEIAATATFTYTFMTIKCSLNRIIECAEETAKEKKYHGFGLVNVKKPDIFNSCYSANIVFFVARN
jgi:hypothetical protein